MNKGNTKKGRLLISATLALMGLLAMPSMASAAWFACQPDLVTESSNRISVHCTNSISLNGNTVTFVAISSTDTAKAARFLSVATSAFLSGKKLSVNIPSSSSTNVSGCAASDCRTPTDFGLSN